MTVLKHIGRLMNKCGNRRLKKEYEQYEYTWIIQNFQKNCCNTPGDRHESPVFWTTGSQYKWTLDLFVGGYDELTAEYVAIRAYLRTKDSDDYCTTGNKGKFMVEFSILDKYGGENSTTLAVFTEEMLNGDKAVFKRFILKRDLLGDPDLLPNNELRIACKISREISSKSEESSKPQTSPENTQPNILLKLLDDNEFSDFIFVVGEKEFHVHRAILAASSPVFKAMFQSEMRESKEGKAHIDDIEPEVMEKLLHFVYIGGEAEAIKGFADKVLIAAEKYQLDSLKQLCENVLANALTVDNVYDTLRLADKYNAMKLQNKAMKFFTENIKKLRGAKNFKTSISLLPINLQTDIICTVANKL